MANGQLNCEIKVVREPKSFLKDMVIPWENLDKKISKLACNDYPEKGSTFTIDT